MNRFFFNQLHLHITADGISIIISTESVYSNLLRNKGRLKTPCGPKLSTERAAPLVSHFKFN